MGIIKNTNSRLNIQLKAQYPADKVSKSTFCLAYAIDEPQSTPGKGKISFTPLNKPDQVTKLTISHTALMGADMKEYLNITTKGTLTLYFKPNADNFAAFEISSATDLGSSTEFSISKILSSDALSVLNVGDQVCITLNSINDAEIIGVIDGGYY